MATLFMFSVSPAFSLVDRPDLLSNHDFYECLQSSSSDFVSSVIERQQARKEKEMLHTSNASRQSRDDSPIRVERQLTGKDTEMRRTFRLLRRSMTLLFALSGNGLARRRKCHRTRCFRVERISAREQ